MALYFVTEEIEAREREAPSTAWFAQAKHRASELTQNLATEVPVFNRGWCRMIRACMGEIRMLNTGDDRGSLRSGKLIHRLD
jgi:hypothetical protein